VSSNIRSGVVEGKETSWGGSYGIGAEFMFNPQLSAVLQYDEYNLKFAGGNRDKINTTSLGLRYRF
jgi:outer membrane autotransporter protein